MKELTAADHLEAVFRHAARLNVLALGYDGLLSAARDVATILEDVQRTSPGMFTCAEAEQLAHLLDLLEDGPERAELFLAVHAEGVEDPEDWHCRRAIFDNAGGRP